MKFSSLLKRFSISFLCGVIYNHVLYAQINTAPNAPVKPSVAATSLVNNDSLALLSKKRTVNFSSVQTARLNLVNQQWAYVLPATGIRQASNVLPFAKNRPTVLILIHGVTGFPSTDPRIGTLKGARNYWGYNFLSGLLGNIQEPITTFADDNSSTGALTSENWERSFINDAIPEHHFLTIYGKPKPNLNFYPFSILMTYRDGSQSFKRQVAQTANQIVSLYNSIFGNWPEDKKPQIVLLCHSFGGLVARTICSNPSMIPSNDNNIPAESFTQDERNNFDFIRNKTVHITTLSTPHEGSPITLNAALGEYLQFIPEVDETDPNTPIIKQLKVSFIDNLNQSALSPNQCRRSNGTLIPIHALGGRVPAGPNYFDNPNEHDNNLETVDGGIGRTNVNRLASNESNRDQFESYNLVRVDYAMHMFFGLPVNLSPIARNAWGVTPSDNRRLDIIKIADVQPVTGCLTLPVYNIASFGAKPRLFYLRHEWRDRPGVIPFTCDGFTGERATNVSDGEIDSDGFVPVNSSLGVKLGTNTTNFFANSTGGSWYRFYRSICDFHNHGTIKFHKAVASWLRSNIIGNEPQSLLFGTLHTTNAAGPNVSRTGTVSSW